MPRTKTNSTRSTMRQLTRSKESLESSIETTKDRLRDGEPETSGPPKTKWPDPAGSDDDGDGDIVEVVPFAEGVPDTPAPRPKEENTFPNSLESPRGIPMPVAGKPLNQALEDDGIIGQPKAFVIDDLEDLENAPSKDLVKKHYDGMVQSFGTRSQGDARMSQLAKEEPFKSRVTTKGFVNAIREHADEEVVPDVDENRPGDFIEEFLDRIFIEPASFPRIVHVRLKAAAWILKVPLAEVEQCLVQMPNAKPLSDGWWELTINDRLESISL